MNKAKLARKKLENLIEKAIDCGYEKEWCMSFHPGKNRSEKEYTLAEISLRLFAIKTLQHELNRCVRCGMI